eukprot:m.51303 g.51303  ORF g.51303 m.51303 type:complete len:65 (-) comp9044_c0_seq3:92-286(-)
MTRSVLLEQKFEETLSHCPHHESKIELIESIRKTRMVREDVCRPQGQRPENIAKTRLRGGILRA